MRYRVCAWMVLAGLWASDARGLQLQGRDDPLAHATTCAEAVSARAAMPKQSAARDAHVEALCAAEAAQPRHDPATEAALAQWHRANTVAVARHVRALMASSDPRDQLAAAMIAPVTEPQDPNGDVEWVTEESTIAFTTARRLGPDDRLVAWLEALDCPRARADSGCDPEGALKRLQRLEPDNTAFWLMLLERAIEQGDDAAVDGMLSRAAATSHYEIPFGEIGQLLYETFRNVDSPPLTPQVAEAFGRDTGIGRAATVDDLAAIGAMGIAMAVALPAHQPLQEACFGEDGTSSRAQRVPACMAIYTRMAGDEMLISRNIALDSLVRLTADSAAGPAWRERLRELHWIRSEGLRLIIEGPPEGHLQSLWRDGEIAALEGALGNAGIPATPPPGWLPEDVRSRALITTGREPPEA